MTFYNELKSEKITDEPGFRLAFRSQIEIDFRLSQISDLHRFENVLGLLRASDFLREKVQKCENVLRASQRRIGRRTAYVPDNRFVQDCEGEREIELKTFCVG